MRVAYYSNHFTRAGGTGVPRYSRELFRALRENCSDDVDLRPVASWTNEDETGRDRLERAGVKFLPWGRWATPLAWTFLNRPPIERWLKPIDVVHLPAVVSPVATRKPLVVTVHDIGPLTHPAWFTSSPVWLFKRALRQAVEQASAIICVSHATAREVENYVAGHMGIEIGKRLHVIHEGVDPSFFDPVGEDCLSTLARLPKRGTPFILTAGKISPRKNLRRVVSALGTLRDQIPHHLVHVGGEGWDTEEVHDEINRLELANRVHLVGYVSEEQLRGLYQKADLYVHPSLFEGFGLPILEAMASGCPVVTSDVYSLPEVAGDAAVLVNPREESEIAEGIRSVCENPELAHDLRDKGMARARQFQWSRCATEVSRIYAEVV